MPFLERDFISDTNESSISSTVIVSSSSQPFPISFLTLHPVWGISSVVELGERKRYSSDESIIHLMPTKKVIIMDHVGWHFIFHFRWRSEQFFLFTAASETPTRGSVRFWTRIHDKVRIQSRDFVLDYISFSPSKNSLWSGKKKCSQTGDSPGSFL